MVNTYVCSESEPISDALLQNSMPLRLSRAGYSSVSVTQLYSCVKVKEEQQNEQRWSSRILVYKGP